jgi:hypothetical protein
VAYFRHMELTGLNLLLPDKPDVERNALADAFTRCGGVVHRIGRFWDPPAFDRCPQINELVSQLQTSDGISHRLHDGGRPVSCSFFFGAREIARG